MSNPYIDQDLPVEAITEACREAYEETSWAFERAIDKAINFGRLLCIAKSKVPHGSWSKWVAELESANRVSEAMFTCDQVSA